MFTFVIFILFEDTESTPSFKSCIQKFCNNNLKTLIECWVNQDTALDLRTLMKIEITVNYP